MTDKLEFKVGDKVKVIRDGLDMEIPVGRVATVIQVDATGSDDYPYYVRYGTASEWFAPSDLQAYHNPYAPLEEADSSDTADIAVKQPIDLYTVEVILDYLCDTIKTANAEGGSHEAVNIAILSYLVGLKEALNG